MYFLSPDLSPALQVHVSTCLVVLLWVLQEADWVGHARDFMEGSPCEVKRVGSWRPKRSVVHFHGPDIDVFKFLINVSNLTWKKRK